MSIRPQIDYQQTDIPLREIGNLLKRQKWVLLGTIGLCIGLGVLGTYVVQKKYRYSLKIAVDGKTQQFPQGASNDPLSAITMPNPSDDVLSQMEVLQSYELWKATVVDGNVGAPAAADLADRDPKVVVRQQGFTNVINIDVESNSPKSAADFGHQLPTTYAQFLQDKQKKTIKGALKFINGRLDGGVLEDGTPDPNEQGERKPLKELEDKLSNYRTTAQIGDPSVDGPERSNRLSHAQADASLAAGQLASAQQTLDTLVQARHALPAKLQTPTTQTNISLREQQKQVVENLKAKRASLLVSYYEDSIQVQEIDAETKRQQTVLEAMPVDQDTKITTKNPSLQLYDDKITDARAQVQSAQANLAQRNQAVEGMRKSVEQFNAAQVVYQRLTKDIATRQAVVDALVREKADLQLRLNTVKDPLSVIEEQTEIIDPFKPSVPLYLALSTLIGLILAFPVASFKDRVDDRVNTVDEAYSIAGAVPIGHLPSLPKRATTLALPGSREEITPESMRLRESYRVLRTNVLLNTSPNKSQSILVTSSGRGEGKSELAHNLAIAMALDNKKVILVDANLRHPTLHRRLKLQDGPGLSEVLLGQATLAEALQPGEVQGLLVLTGGKAAEFSAEILGTPAMERLHQEMKDAADLVIIDSPAAVPDADAQILSQLADNVLFVVQLSKSKRTSMGYTIELLKQAKANIIGLVFTRTGFSGDRVPYSFKRL